MTEPTTNHTQQREEIDAALEDAHQQEANLERALRLQFAQGWEQRPELYALPVTASFDGPGAVAFTPQENNTAATGPVTLVYDINASLDNESVNLYTPDGANLHQITAHEAANRLGVDIEVMVQTADGASSLVREDSGLHRTLTELHNERVPQLEKDLEDVERREATSEAAPAWAIDSEDRSITPERVLSDWVQSQTMVDTYLQTDRADLARQWIEELDENLEAFAEGGAPPGSDELASVYHDAVARAAIPYGEAPISVDEVRQQLENIGARVPEVNEAMIRESTGLMPLDRTMVTNALDQSAQGLPEGLEDVAAARLSVRRAIASITEDSEAAQTHLTAANSALTHAVGTLRPDQARAGMLEAQESVQQASEKVSAVADTAAAVDAEVTLYTTPECVGCAATKRALDKAGVEYEEIPLQEHPHLVQQFKKQGLAQAPIVETKDGERWAGYNPQKLREHGLDYRSRQQRSGESGKDAGHGR